MEIMIETERLILRTMRLHDVSQEYADWLSAPKINRYLSCAGMQQTIKSCRDYVKSYEGQDDKALIGIFFKDNRLHIGNLTFSKIDWKNKTGAIGICIGRKGYARRGLGKEALDAVVKHCFEQLKLLRLQAYINTNNKRSVDLFKKCGFRIEAVVRGAKIIDGETQKDYVMSIAEPEYHSVRF